MAVTGHADAEMPHVEQANRKAVALFEWNPPKCHAAWMSVCPGLCIAQPAQESKSSRFRVPAIPGFDCPYRPWEIAPVLASKSCEKRMRKHGTA